MRIMSALSSLFAVYFLCQYVFCDEDAGKGAGFELWLIFSGAADP